MAEKKSFVFNDPNKKNSYGFRILTAGIGLDRFRKNPMMLNNHWNSTENVLGKWINERVEGDLLIGDPVFDLVDKAAAEIAGKVERDFINSCSMGITFNREDFKLIGDELILEKCELYEVSIVAVPSNENSIRLYSENGEILKDDDVKALCLSLQTPDQEENDEINLNFSNMKKIILSVATLVALGFDKATPEQDVEAVEAAVAKLSAEKTALSAKLLALESAAETQKEVSITEMVELGIKEGKIPATKKEDFVRLGQTDLNLLKTTLESIPTKATLSNQVSNSTATGEVKSIEDFQKLSLTAQLEFKAKNPEEYKKLFN